MKVVLVSVIVYLSAMSFNAMAKTKDADAKMCLSSVYAAELAVKMEEPYYSEDMEKLGLEKNCERRIQKIEIEGHDKFTAFVETDEKKVWMINERKELRLISTKVAKPL